MRTEVVLVLTLETEVGLTKVLVLRRSLEPTKIIGFRFTFFLFFEKIGFFFAVIVEPVVFVSDKTTARSGRAQKRKGRVKLIVGISE